MDDVDVFWPAIARADADAFARFLAHAEAPLRSSLLRFSRSVDVEAVVQETLLRIWQVAPHYRPDGEPNGLLRLAVRIGRNLALDECKRIRRQAEPVGDALDELAVCAEPSPDPLFRQAVQGCLDALAGKPREALQLRLASAGGEDDRTLAARCHMSHNTYLQNVSRARQTLAECLRRKTGWESHA